MDKDVTKEVTLGVLESIIENRGSFKTFGIDRLEILPVVGYEPDFSDKAYVE